ncbi:alpha/beta hydrolase, partial [Amycolatopsis sp. NPDC051114]
MTRTVQVLLGLVLVAVLVLTLVWIFQRRLIYQPDTAPVPAAGTVLPGAEDVRLRTADGLE